MKVYIAKEHMANFTQGEGYLGQLINKGDRVILSIFCNDNGNNQIITNRPLQYFTETEVTTAEVETMLLLETEYTLDKATNYLIASPSNERRLMDGMEQAIAVYRLYAAIKNTPL